MSKLQVVGQLWQLMRAHKNYGLAPIIRVLALVGFVLVLTDGTTSAAFICAFI